MNLTIADPKFAKDAAAPLVRALQEAGAPPRASDLGMVYQVLVSADGQQRQYVYVSPNCLTLNGVAAEAVMADPMALHGLIAPDHRALVKQAMDEAIRDNVAFNVEAPFLRPDGAVRWHRLTSTPRRTADGQTLWDGIQMDITERKLAELALEREQRRLSLALDAAGLGLWEYDIAADHLIWSDRVKALYGLEPDAPVTFDIYRSHIHPDDRERVLASYEQVRARPGGGDFSFEHRTRAPDGTVRWLLAHGRVTSGPDGQADRVIGTALDITERKHAEEARALLFQELNHRMKNNFQVIAAMLQMQQRDASPETAQALQGTLDRVQAIARAHANLYADGRVGQVDFAAYLRDLCGSLDQGLLDRDRISLSVAADPFDLDPDRTAAAGMLVNELVTNAVKHAFTGRDRGRIQVEFRVGPEGPRLSVEDDGHGFDRPGDRRAGLGTRLIDAFARQARGALIRSQNGSRVELLLEP